MLFFLHDFLNVHPFLILIGHTAPGVIGITQEEISPFQHLLMSKDTFTSIEFS